jgi:hypothetical protein
VPVKVGDVFVPGGLPGVTYVPRADLQLEAQVQDYLEERYKVLSLSGPTKSGKTVLVKRVAPDALWVSGGDVSTVTDFWKVLVDRLDGWIEVEKQRAKTDSESVTAAVEGGLSAGIVKAGASGGTQTTALDERVHTVRRDRLPAQVAADLLLLTKPVIVLDDFHYLGAPEQLKVVRGLRSLVFEGVPVILLSVPHRVYDAVRAEPEMTGRVVPLGIPFWSDDDLRMIAAQGFEALNVTAAPATVGRLVQESFGSPFLMQDFCLELCKENGVREEQEESFELQPTDWDSFFHRRADATAKLAFERLARGPRVRTKRIPRELRDGRTVDIYNLVLEAIAHTGPKTTLTDTELRESIRDIMAGEPPKSHEVTRVLEEMTSIARKGKGEPVVDYIADERQLHIADPFFAYYLRWHKPPAAET